MGGDSGDEGNDKRIPEVEQTRIISVNTCLFDDLRSIC